MNRTSAAAYLTGEYATLASEVGFDSTAASVVYNTATDMALRQLGYAESDIAAADVLQASVMDYLSLLNYYALKRFARELSIRVNVQIAGSVSSSRSQAYAQVKALLDDAQKEVEARGFSVTKPVMGAGRLTLDFLEPSIPEWTGDWTSEWYS